MKKVIAFLILSLSLTSFAGPMYLAGLTCEASNGVSLKTLGVSQSGTHVVEAEWGGFKKLFKAQLAQVGYEQPGSVVALVDSQGTTQYLLNLPVDAKLRGYQMAEGSLMGVGLSGSTYKIANVSCRVHLDNKK
jgi:hypothetical protein